jgi:hypothetical protein
VEPDPYGPSDSGKADRDKDILFRFGQHYAARNTEPSEMCSEAAEQVRALVNSANYTLTRMKINKECLEAQERDEVRPPDGLALSCLDDQGPPIRSFLSA